VGRWDLGSPIGRNARKRAEEVRPRAYPSVAGSPAPSHDLQAGRPRCKMKTASANQPHTLSPTNPVCSETAQVKTRNLAQPWDQAACPDCVRLDLQIQRQGGHRHLTSVCLLRYLSMLQVASDVCKPRSDAMQEAVPLPRQMGQGSSRPVAPMQGYGQEDLLEW